MLTIACPSCHRPLQVAEQLAGAEIPCPSCKEDMTVPELPPPIVTTKATAKTTPAIANNQPLTMPPWSSGAGNIATGILVSILASMFFGAPEGVAIAAIGNVIGGSFLLFGIIRLAIEPLLLQNEIMALKQERNAHMIAWEIRQRQK